MEVKHIVKIKICDAMMGSGKTSAAIRLINEDSERRFVFITPFLDEVKRIKDNCPSKRFTEPYYSKSKNKLESLKDLLGEKRNIASTHALFKKYDDYTRVLISEGHYTLILDEVADVVETVSIGDRDISIMLNEGLAVIDDMNRVHWQDDTYPQNQFFSECMRTIKSGHVVMNNGKLMLWLFPIEVFGAFDEVIVLTHMFEAQMQRYYYDLHGAQYEYIGVTPDYQFCKTPCKDQSHSALASKIHIIDDEKLNAVGDNPYALSVSWFERESKIRGAPSLARIKANAENVVRQRWEASSGEILWSTFKDNRSKLAGRGYTRGFLEYNARATNKYRNRIYLMYLVNIFFLVDIKNYFLERGISVLEDRYALSVMLQWLWRSAIRDGKEVWLYLPSSRMRTLLTNWLEEQN